MVADYNTPAGVSRSAMADHPIRPGRDSASGRAALERRTIHIPDVLADPEYSFGGEGRRGVPDRSHGPAAQGR